MWCSMCASHSRDIWEVQGGGGREDVLEVLGAGLFEAVQRAPTEVFGQALVLLTLPGELHRLVLWDGHTDHLTMQTLTVQMTHRLENKPRDNVLQISFNPETNYTYTEQTFFFTFEQQKLMHKSFFPTQPLNMVATYMTTSPPFIYTFWLHSQEEVLRESFCEMILT